MRHLEAARRSWATRLQEAKDLPLPPAAPVRQAPGKAHIEESAVEEIYWSPEDSREHLKLFVPPAAPLKTAPTVQSVGSEHADLPLPPPAPLQQAPSHIQERAQRASIDSMDSIPLDLPPPAPLKPAPAAEPLEGKEDNNELPLPPTPPLRRAPQQVVQVRSDDLAEESIDSLELPPPAPLKPAPAAQVAHESDADDMPLPPPAPVQPVPSEAWVEPIDGCRPRASQGRPVIPPLPLAASHPVEEAKLSPESSAEHPISVEDIRFWTVERYQMHRKKKRFVQACSCENFEEQQLRLMLFAGALIMVGVLAIGARDVVTDRMVSEAVLFLGIFFIVLGVLSGARGCCVRGEVQEEDEDHPDAIPVGKPLL